ncbi:MAG: hypothetical protein WC280_03755 [Patescibacteria group bacterium]
MYGKKKNIEKEISDKIVREIVDNFRKGNQSLSFFVSVAVNNNFSRAHDYYKRLFYKELIDEARKFISSEKKEEKEREQIYKEFEQEDEEFLTKIEMVKRMKELRDNNDPQYMKNDIDDEYKYLDDIDIKESEEKKKIIKYSEYTKESKKKNGNLDTQLKINFR